MTVSPQAPRAQYDIPGGVVSVPVPFAVSAVEELTVWIAKGDVRRQLHAGEWSFDAGILTTAAGPGILTAARRVPLSQPVRYRNGAPVYPAVLEGALDRATRQIQDLAAGIERSLRLHPAVAGPIPAMEQPVPHGLLILDEAGAAIRFDRLIKDQLLTARDETLAASTRAVHEAALAQASQVMAAASAVASRGAAETRFFFRNEAQGFAERAIAAQTIVQAAAEWASWTLGLMGLANNLTQLLYTVAPFLTRLFGLWKDFGWINQDVQITVDFGWACMAAANRCRDFDLVADKADGRRDLNLDGEGQDWGSIVDPARCYLPPEPVCLDDLGWINAVLPLNSAQPISLPIRLPDPCPVIFTEPSPPPAGGASQC